MTVSIVKADCEWLDWHGCYDDGWRGLIVDEAFAHPAKAARGLIRRIVAHLESQDWLPPRSRVLDVFGGIGTTAIEGASRGHEVVCVELESKFVELALQNFQLHRRTWEVSGDPLPVILQGDSRRAVELVRWHFAASISSPAYGGQQVRSNDVSHSSTERDRTRHGGKGFTDAGGGSFAQQGQLSAMPEGDFSAAVGSPPYAESIRGEHCEVETAKESHAARSDPKAGGSLGKSCRFGGYGGRNNLGNLPEGSLVFCSRCGKIIPAVQQTQEVLPPQKPSKAPGGSTSHPAPLDCKPSGGMRNGATCQPATIAESRSVDDQKPDTFWASARQILEQVHQLVRPGGMTAWIVKDYVKAGKRVPFCDNWARLCEATGFRVVQRVRCWLVKEETHAGLFGPQTTKKERKSFFRRLHERKPGAVRIDWEEVIFAERTGA